VEFDVGADVEDQRGVVLVAPRLRDLGDDLPVGVPRDEIVEDVPVDVVAVGVPLDVRVERGRLAGQIDGQRVLGPLGERGQGRSDESPESQDPGDAPHGSSSSRRGSP
jgi:hypothetical protein